MRYKYLQKILEEENQYEREKNKKLENYLEEVLSANRCMMAERETLIAQNITDVKKLQEDTLCWKERYIRFETCFNTFLFLKLLLVIYFISGFKIKTMRHCVPLPSFMVQYRCQS